MSKRMEFRWPHEAAESVRLAGSFNSWQPQDMLFDSVEGLWKVEQEVSPGRHQFKFVVDGLWVHDEDQPHTPNEVGSHNNVVEVLSPTKPSSPAAQIEVERKFQVPEDFGEALPARGYELVTGFAEEAIVDEYFDTRRMDLVRADHWLRRRNGDWEMKYPVGTVTEGSGVTLYHETSSAEEILSRLRDLTRDEPDKSDLGDLASRGVLAPFARLETRRRSYRKGEVSIVVDATDWGYRIGEIEIMVARKEDAPEAAQKIDDIAKELAFSTFTPAKLMPALASEE